MARNGTELNIVDVAGVQNGVVPQANVVADDDVQNVVVPQVDAPAVSGGDQNNIISQVDQNDKVQQAGVGVELAESSDDKEIYEVEDEQRGKKMKYQRYTQEQYNELENFFLKHPYPTEKQRIELSMKIGMEMDKIMFWFQNRRTHMKIKLKRHENILLKNQNDQLIAENAILRQNVTEPMCTCCGGPVVPTPLAFQIEQLIVAKWDPVVLQS
ncbi:Homeobox-leucine zipper protein ROC5 [Linum perenne]